MNKFHLGMVVILACALASAGQTAKTKKEPMLTAGTAIEAQLQKTIDINKAATGDQVALKTTKSIKQGGEIVVPKGSTLVGRITDVQRRTREDGGSRIAMIFDRVEGRKMSMPLSATLVSITNAKAAAAASDTMMADVAGTSQTSASASRTSSNGGLLGGVGNTVGGLVNTTTQTVGTVTNTVQGTAGMAAGTAGRTLNGIQISGSASGSAHSSTTLSSPNQNLRVEKGATFHLRVVQAVPKTE